MMRLFVFGHVGNEGLRTARERDRVYAESIGTREQVRALHNLWQRLDNDGSGRVDIGEFRALAEPYMKDMLSGVSPDSTMDGATPWVLAAAAFPELRSPEDMPRFVSKLSDRLAQLLLGKKSSFTVEDMMRLIWPSAQISDLREMRRWTQEFLRAARRRRVEPPPVLPEADFEGLCSVFRYFDEDGSGEVLMDELVSRGLIYEDQADSYFRQWDKNGDGVLDLLEFCVMMCPNGYRAHSEARIGTRLDGTRIIFDPILNYWRLEDDEGDAGYAEDTGA